MILKAEGLHLSFGGLKALIDVSVEVKRGNFYLSSVPMVLGRPVSLIV